MPSFAVEFSDASVRDLDDIYEHLQESYEGFGESEDEAISRAVSRTLRIRNAGLALGKQPHQGTLHPRLLPGLRSVTKDRAIFYFITNDDAVLITVLAIFFGGQDHQREMLKRLLSE